MPDQTSLTVVPEAQIQRVPLALPALVGSVGAARSFRAEAIALHRKATCAQAFVAISTSCLRQIALNEPGVRAGSGEAVHQMRVGLRRLRAALSIFDKELSPGKYEGLKHELVWLTEQLAAARDYDVLGDSLHTSDDVVGAMLERNAPESELARELNRRREEAQGAARRAVESARFERLIGSAAVSLISHLEEGDSDRSAREFAREILEHRSRRVLRRLKRFASLDVHERHRLRISVKKLRYGADFFATLFPKARRSHERFNRVLEALQELLGKLNDIAVQQRIARQMLEQGNEGLAGRRISFALGALTASRQAELVTLQRSVAQLRRRFRKAPRFWRRN